MTKALPKKPTAMPATNNLETRLTYLKRPKFQWLTIERLGTLGGGLNAGIATMRLKHDPLNRIFIEKTFRREDVERHKAHREIALLRQVGDHTHITRMYDHFIDEGARRSCLYMELCDKGSLLDLIMNCGRNECVSERNVWDWLIQVMSALVYCHRGPHPDDEVECLNWASIYHRDIKPANILLTSDPARHRVIAKLADFGCATSDEWTFRTKDVWAAAHASAQTPGFDPPEYPRYSGSSDVWQSALVFVCVCNRESDAPRSRNNPGGKQWNQERPAGADYSRDLSLALESCLIKDWTRRPGALKSYRFISEIYGALQRQTPTENHPLGRFVPGTRNAMRFHGPGQPGHILSDPGAERVGYMPPCCADCWNAQEYPQDPWEDEVELGLLEAWYY